MADRNGIPINAVDEGRQALVELGAIGTLPLALRSVIQLQIPQIIAKSGPEGGLSAAQIASVLPGRAPNPGYLERIMRALASRGIFTESRDERQGNGLAEVKFSLNSMSRLLVESEDGLSLGPLIELNTEEALLKPFHHFSAAILEGQNPFRRVANGMHLFQYTRQNPAINDLFNRGMSALSVSYMRAILDSGYQGFQNANTLVDVGGGSGTNISLIVTKHPHIRGINFDLPHVVATANPFPGVEHAGGDMFEFVPKADVIFMKYIIHNWNDDLCVKLLKNCYDALPPEGGKLIMVEMLLSSDLNDQSPEARVAHLYDVVMMAGNDDGKERSKDEFNRLLRAAGFSSLNVMLKLDFLYVMEAFKSSTNA